MKTMTKNEAFEYLKGKKTMVVNKEQSRKVQEVLLKAGFKWEINGAKVRRVDQSYLFTSDYGFITNHCNAEYFKNSDLEFILPFDILDIEVEKEKKEPQFKVGEWVLVRDYDSNWVVAQFAYKAQKGKYPYVIFGGDCFEQCIPYEGNEHLMGTSELP